MTLVLVLHYRRRAVGWVVGDVLCTHNMTLRWAAHRHVWLEIPEAQIPEGLERYAAAARRRAEAVAEAVARTSEVLP